MESTNQHAESAASSGILVVEDDANILNLLSAYLESAGHRVITASNGEDGLRQALDNRFRICIFDVMLPGISGVEIASAMRTAGCATPILFLTALGGEADVLRGFSAGADDYIVKPFSPRVLLVRIEAILRRLETPAEKSPVASSPGALQLGENEPACSINGITIELTPHEYRILRQLTQQPDRVFSRRTLIANIYGNEDAVIPKAIDVHMHNLRAKLGDDKGELIQTVRGFGYKFSASKRNRTQ